MSEQKAHGPYRTEAEALADAAPLIAAERAVDPGNRPMTDAIRDARLQARIRHLAHALVDAGVELGDYDRRIAAWLCDWEDATLQVLVGWIERAHAAGHSAGNLGANWAHHVAAQKAATDPAPAPEVTHHAVMRNGVADAECGTWQPWESMTRAWKDVTCPGCIATLDGESGGAA